MLSKLSLVLLFSCFRVYSLSSPTVVDNLNHAHIAFVFAGGVRSFVMPTVHESIRYNLIHAFCPPSTCTGDVFVRLSIADNTHDGAGKNSTGKAIEGGEEKLNEALQYLDHLSHDSIDGKLVYEVVNIGSPEEALQMDSITNKSVKQKIYRDLDPRRYSMYFNRWAAYQLAMQEEIKSNKKYTWVVHARLDMAWGAPVKPYNMWSAQKVWVPDCWYADVPDTFALLPRHFSEFFYTLDGQYEPPEVMCLGGPNFDPNSLNRDSLLARGYTEEEITLAQQSLCLLLHNYDTIFEPSQNLTWSLAGTSEKYLARKLHHHKISREHGTLGFSSFFTFIVRYPLNFVCFYLEPKGLITWVKNTQRASFPVSQGCYNMWKSTGPLYAMGYGPNCDKETSTYPSKIPLVPRPMSTCLLDKRMTDWNYLPFRIRRRGNICATIVNHPAGLSRKEGTALTMSECLDVVTIMKDNSATADYHQAQLLHMFPLSPLPQRITTWDYLQGIRCLTVSSNFAVIGSNTDTNPAPPYRLLELQACHPHPNYPQQLFQLKFLGKSSSAGRKEVISTKNTSVAAADSELDWPSADPLRRLQSAHYEPLLAGRNAMMIQWTGENSHYCLSYTEPPQERDEATGEAQDSPHRGYKHEIRFNRGDVVGLEDSGLSGAHNTILKLSDVQSGIQMLSDSRAFVVLGPCFQDQDWSKQQSGKRSAQRSTVFVIERSQIKSPTV